jgi:putative oxidoreductase
MSTIDAQEVSRPDSKGLKVVLWVLQILVALAMLGAGVSKLAGAETMVHEFEAVGLGQWFRYLTGALEIGGAVLLLVPRLSGVGALLLGGVMAGAVVAHLVKLGGSPVPALVLLGLLVVIAWGRRGRTLALLGR